MLAEEFKVIDGNSPLWLSSKSLLDVAKGFEREDETYSWNGWGKQQIRKFLHSLPSRSSIVVGVWEVLCENEGHAEHEELVVGLVCEVIDGEVRSVRTFDALKADGLKPSDQLEPGVDDAREIIQHVERVVAPVAWALFTEKATWDELLLPRVVNGTVVDKAKQFDTLIQEGRCVIMGNQTMYQ